MGPIGQADPASRWAFPLPIRPGRMPPSRPLLLVVACLPRKPISALAPRIPTGFLEEHHGCRQHQISAGRPPEWPCREEMAHISPTELARQKTSHCRGIGRKVLRSLACESFRRQQATTGAIQQPQGFQQNDALERERAHPTASCRFSIPAITRPRLSSQGANALPCSGSSWLATYGSSSGARFCWGSGNTHPGK